VDDLCLARVHRELTFEVGEAVWNDSAPHTAWR
jgi:hypothetical protein